MPIRIYNTLTRTKEELRPIEEGHVKIYVCGITSYDFCHIGHARSFLVFDMIVRYLRYRGYKVTFVRNFTDIDDKIINRAREQGVDSLELANRFIEEFYADTDRLGILRPDLEPRATEHIREMIELIRDLIDKGLAYEVNGDVYFRVDRFDRYGTLSGRNLEDMQAGARIEVNEQKRHPMDFALWKASKPGEPTWDSPWGPGRPGWHIECSAMSRKYLGETFDIHGGGQDLIFPHHENEIAQSVGATGKPFANIWIHHGFVTIRDEKMSKSLGNFLTIREIMERYPPEALRLFIFSTHYRNPLDYSEAAMEDAVAAMDRMYDCLARIAGLGEGEGGASVIGPKDREKIESLRQRFQYAMDNDFNTAQGLGLLFDAVKVLNKGVQAQSPRTGREDAALLREGGAAVRELAGILGLLQQDARQYIHDKKQQRLAGIDISLEEIEELIEERARARERKDWAAGDAIRDRLMQYGIELKDGSEGTTWEVRI
jgi:cysteinyl-tRNA synthetase